MTHIFLEISPALVSNLLFSTLLKSRPVIAMSIMPIAMPAIPGYDFKSTQWYLIMGERFQGMCQYDLLLINLAFITAKTFLEHLLLSAIHLLNTFDTICVV